MPDVLVRLGKGIVFFLLMYFGLLKLGVPQSKAVAISLIPLMASLVNVMANTLFSLTVLIFSAGMLNIAMDGALAMQANKLLDALVGPWLHGGKQ